MISISSKANENQMIMVCDKTPIYKLDTIKKVKNKCKAVITMGGMTTIKDNSGISSSKNKRAIIKYSILNKKQKDNKIIKFIFLNDELQFIL
tara:strand:- start:9475 stop:9750 length:276 start_codon:yes stop_codon:yes gene_type:complete